MSAFAETVCKREAILSDPYARGEHADPFAGYLLCGKAGKIFALSYEIRDFSRAQHFEAKWQEDGFVRVHHAFLLNLRSVKAVRGDEVELINQESIPISRSKKHRFYETLQTFQPDDAS